MDDGVAVRWMTGSGQHGARWRPLLVDRAAFAAVTALALVLIGVGCSNSDERSGETTAASVATTESTILAEDFDDQVDALDAQVAAAGTDPCKLAAALQVSPPAPSSPDQYSRVVSLYVHLMNSVSAVLGPETEHGQQLTKLAGQMQAAADNGANQTDLAQSAELVEILSSQEMANALLEFQNRTAECPGAAGAGG